MWKNNILRERAGTLNICLILSVCIGLISGCAAVDHDRDRHNQADAHIAQAREYLTTASDLFNKHRYDEAEKYATMGLQEFEESQHLCAISISCQPNSKPVQRVYKHTYSLRASIRVAEGKFSLAIKDANDGLYYDKNDPILHYVIGYCSVETGDFDTADREQVILESIDKKLAGDLYARIASAKLRGLKMLIQQ